MSTVSPKDIADAVAQQKAALAAEKQVRVYHVNPSAGPLQHGDYSLPKGGSAVVPESVATLWMTHQAYGNPVVETHEPAAQIPNKELETAKAETDEAKKAVADLQARNEALQKMLDELQAQKTGAVDVSKLPGSSPSPEETAATKKAAKAK